MSKEPTQTMTIRVPQSLHLRIQMEANKDNRTINNWVSKVIKEYIDNEKKRG